MTGAPAPESLEQIRATPADSILSRLANPGLVLPMHLGKPTQPQEITRGCAQSLAGGCTGMHRAAPGTAPGSKRLRPSLPRNNPEHDIRSTPCPSPKATPSARTPASRPVGEDNRCAKDSHEQSAIREGCSRGRAGLESDPSHSPENDKSQSVKSADSDLGHSRCLFGV